MDVLYISRTVHDIYVIDLHVPARRLTWDEGCLHENKSNMTSRQEYKKGKHVSNYLPRQTSEITSGEQKEGHVSQDLPPQSDAIISQGGTSIANEKDEVKFESEKVIRDLLEATIKMLKEI